MSVSDFSRATRKPFPTSLDVQRSLALCFPHWIFWALTLIIFAVIVALDFAMPQIEIAPAGYRQVAMLILAAVAPLIWRYMRFNSFDWFTHRAWNILMLVLWVAATSEAVGLMGFELTALRLPLWSSWLNAGDRAMGFDWNAFASLVLSARWSEWLFFNAYNAGTDIAIKATFVFALLINNRRRLLELCFMSTTTGLICSLIGGLFPAYIAFSTVAHQSITDHLYANDHFSLHGVADQFTALRTVSYFYVNPANLVGLVNFPSYHCCVAMMIIFCSRGLGWISLIQTMIGLSIIIATPVFGGHYLTDLVGGAVLWLACFGIWHYLLKKRVAPSMPGTQESDFQWPKNWHFARHFAYRG